MIKVRAILVHFDDFEVHAAGNTAQLGFCEGYRLAQSAYAQKYSQPYTSHTQDFSRGMDNRIFSSKTGNIQYSSLQPSQQSHFKPRQIFKTSLESSSQCSVSAAHERHLYRKGRRSFPFHLDGVSLNEMRLHGRSSSKCSHQIFLPCHPRQLL